MESHTWYTPENSAIVPSPFQPKPPLYSPQVWSLYTSNYVSWPSPAEVRAYHQLRLATIRDINTVPRVYYLRTFEQTKEFVKGVEGIARLMGEVGMEGGLGAGALLIDFSVHILRGKQSKFHVLLNSQRLSIYHLLDTAILDILLSAWESNSPSSQQWPDAIAALASDISHAMSNIPAWAEHDSCEIIHNKETEIDNYMDVAANMEEALRTWYFARTRQFLEESLEIYWVKRKVNACIRGRLPVELVEEIVESVLEFEGLPTGRLRSKYFPKGKEKMVDTRVE